MSYRTNWSKPLRSHIMAAVVVSTLLVACGGSPQTEATQPSVPVAIPPTSASPAPAPPVVDKVPGMPERVVFDVRRGSTVWGETVGQFKAHTSLSRYDIETRVNRLVQDAAANMPWWNAGRVPPGGMQVVLRDFGTKLEPYPLHDAAFYYRQLVDKVSKAGSPRAAHDAFWAAQCVTYTELMPDGDEAEGPARDVLTAFSQAAIRYVQDKKPFVESDFTVEDAPRIIQGKICQ